MASPMMGLGSLLSEDDVRKKLLGPGQPTTTPPDSALKMPTMAPPSPVATAIPKIGAPTARQAEYDRLTNPNLESSKAGWQQIKNPFLRGLAGVASTIGTIAAPRIAEAIPGTSLHHQALVNNARGEVNQDVVQHQHEATADEQEANAAHLNQETTDLQNPTPPAPKNEFELWHQQNPTGTIDDFHQHQQPKNESVQQGYANAISDALRRGVDPSTDPHVMAWQHAIASTQKEAAPKADDRAREIYSKEPAMWTPEEKAFIKGYEKQVNVTKTQPGVARMEVLMNGRTVQVVDPENPENVVYDTAGHARQSRAAAPQSIPFQTDKGVQKAFTSGAESKTLNAFNTAHEHLQQLRGVADALGNGNVQAVNELSQRWAQATGSKAPTNFDAIKMAVAGEVAKTFKGGQVTQGEMDELNNVLSRAQSPQQISGVIDQFTKLMESKRHSLQQQYEQGRQGKPNFGEGSDVVEEYVRDPKTNKLVKKNAQ